MATSTEISKTDDGVRLMRWFVRNFAGVPTRDFYKMCRGGQIRVNSKRVQGNEILRAGDVIRIPPTVGRKESVKRNQESGERFSLSDLEKLRATIIHNDDEIVVFNKPAGLAVQGGSGIKKSVDKMAAALFPYSRVSLVHRLDRDTSGILVVAKSQNAAQSLARQFQDKTVSKEYLALLSGRVSPTSGILDNYMVKGRVFENDEKFPTDGPRPVHAITEYRVLSEVHGMFTWVLFKPKTGRTHQLRMHSAFSLGAPIVGDGLYGRRQKAEGKSDNVLDSMLDTRNLFLFAHKLTLRHPATDKIMTFRAELPEFIKPVVKFLELKIPE